MSINLNFNQPDADVQLIARVLTRNRNTKVIIGLLLFIIGIILILSAPLSNLPHKAIFVLVLLCMLVSFTGLYFFLSGILQYDTQKNFLLALLQKQPEQVIWVYYQTVAHFPFGIRFIQLTTFYIFLIQHEKISLQISESTAQTLQHLLQKRLPHATFGYTKDRQQLYDIAPDLLRK